MRKTIIALQGPPSSGKTTAIRSLFDKILQDPQTGYRPLISDHLKRAFWIGAPRPHSRTTEVGAILIYHGKRIGITTLGDTAKQIRESLTWFFSDNCDIIICACRTTGKTAPLLQAQASRGYHLLPLIPKEKCRTKADRDRSDKEALDSLFSALQALIPSA